MFVFSKSTGTAFPRTALVLCEQSSSLLTEVHFSSSDSKLEACSYNTLILSVLHSLCYSFLFSKQLFHLRLTFVMCSMGMCEEPELLKDLEYLQVSQGDWVS